MGQQQLLLLVLGMIVVGVAVVVGIGTFDRVRTQANADALITESLRIASDIQIWALKPGMSGGRLESETIAQVTPEDVGLPTNNGIYYGVDGEYSFSITLIAGCEAPNVPSGNTPLIYVTAINADTGNIICVAVAGTSAQDIGTSARYGNGVTS